MTWACGCLKIGHDKGQEKVMQYEHGYRMDVSFLWGTVRRRMSCLCPGAGEA